MPLNRRAFEIAALSVAIAIGVAMAARLASADGLLLEDRQPVFGDFICFWSAGRAALEGHASRVYDAPFLYAYSQAAVPGIAYATPFNSPPTFLLLLLGMAWLPFPYTALAFLVGSCALYFYAARKILPDARALLFAATMPAAFFHLGSVQTGLFIAGISGLALHWLDKRPRTAGALVALLAIKPHLALLWPLLLAMSGRWRAFSAACIGTLLFTSAAGLAFGFPIYADFLENLTASLAYVSAQRIATPAYASLYGNLLDLGAPRALALIAHAASALAAMAVAAWTFRRGERVSQGAALCAATLLISPYLFFYDFTLLGVGAAMLGAPRDRLELVALIFAWDAGLSLALGYLAPLPLCPLAAWLVLIAALRRRGNAAPALAPARHT